MSALEAYKNLRKAQSQQFGKECCSFNKLLEPDTRMNATSTFLETKQPCSVCVEIFTVFCAAVCSYMFCIYTLVFSNVITVSIIFSKE